MRKTTLKILSILSLALLIVFISCEKDLYDDAIHHHHKHANKISLKQFLNETGIKNFEKSIKVPIASADINARTANISDFNITTDSIYKLVSQENKTTYSFYIEPTSFTAEENEIFNLIYLKSDNVWEHTIIGLEKTSVQSPNQPLYQSSELLYDSRIQNNTTYTREVCITEVYNFHCTGTGQCRYGQCDMCYLCVDRTLTVDFCGGSGGSSNPSDGSSDNTGGGDGSNSNDPYDFTPNDGSTPFQKSPCQKVRELLDSQPVFKQKLKALAPQAATATFEKAVALYADNTTAEFDGANAKIDIPLNPAEKYLALAHIHDPVGNGNGTYSVFSFGDINWIGVVDVVNSKANLDKFVSFLATADGTFYAITISDKAKFRAAFNYLKYANPNITSEQRMQYLEIADKKQKIYDKYYLETKPHPNYPLIKENGGNNETDLENFLNFIAEGNFGISVLETDVNFETFSEVKKKTNSSQTSLPRIPCTN